MKFYFAARYGRLDELTEYRGVVGSLGHEVTSRWLNGSHRITDTGLLQVETVRESGARFASDDLEDIWSADTVVCFTDAPRSVASRGGRHVEMGYALALSRQVVVVGPRENVFCCLPHVDVYESWDDAMAWISRQPSQVPGT